MAGSQVIEHLVVVYNGIYNKNNGGAEPLKFSNGFNKVLDNKTVAEKIETGKQYKAYQDKHPSNKKKLVQEREAFFSLQELSQENKIKEKAKTENYKVQIAFKIIIKPGGCFIIIGLQEKKQSHEKSKTSIIHKLETAV